MTDPNELDDTLSGLEASLLVQERLVSEVRNLRTSNRRLVTITGVLLVLMAVTGVFGGIALNAQRETRHTARVATAAAELAQQQADENKASLKTSCEATNDSRAKTVSVWETFMQLVAPTPTPDAQVIIDKLLTFVRTTYAPRDCAALVASP